MISYFLCLVLFSVGLFAILRMRNILKIIIGVIICEYSLNLFFVLIGYKEAGKAPINPLASEIKNVADPFAQALAMTAIIISLATTVILVALAMRLYEKYGTFDITKIRELRG